MKASEFDRRFDGGEDVSEALDWSIADRPNLSARRVNVESHPGSLPGWIERHSGSA